ncbi:putative sodium-coupled neutral amino acid transporter 10 [Pieris rapae]|uniref:putative sodium-coupled neutral amino acid transporter 10 n=1 Tax=Pieris rapae TaxID=64459 RepID=UPI001E27BF31|nr:putative sodium-coupled neutral amino acid transporter 10 [Pieris rapae]
MGTTGQSVTLANSIIGVGILAMPFCFQQCGALLAALILMSMGLVSRLCCYFLLKAAIITRRRNYEFLAFHVFGPSGKMAVEVGIIGFLMGTCIAYFVVVGDLGPQIISKMFNINQSDMLRTSIMVIVSLVCVLPLGLLRNVDSLSNVSAATIAFYFCLVIKVICEAGSQMFAPDWQNRIEMWRPSGFLQCVPIFSMALFCQTQLFEIFESLPSLSLEKMNVVTKNAINICASVYFTLGLFGYIAFSEHQISGNVLMSLSPTMASDVIKLGFVMSVACSFPLIIFPCRASLYSFLYRKVHPSHHDHIINHSIPESTFRCITVAIIAVSLFISLMLPNVELVLGLVGSTIGVLVCVVFPAACFINVTFKNTNERVLAKFTVVLGLIILVLGTYANLQAAENTRDKYDEKFITQEKIDKIVEDFFEKMEKTEGIPKPQEIEPKKDENNNDVKDSVALPPNPVPPESQSNEKPKSVIEDKKDIIPDDKEKEINIKTSDEKLQNGKAIDKEKQNGQTPNVVNGEQVKDIEEKAKEVKSHQEKVDMDKHKQLMETIKQHGQEQKELIKEQKEILDKLRKTKNELEKNKKENDNEETKKIAVESIQKIANMAIQSLTGVSDKPLEIKGDMKPDPKVDDVMLKKTAETLDAIKNRELKEKPVNVKEKIVEKQVQIPMEDNNRENFEVKVRAEEAKIDLINKEKANDTPPLPQKQEKKENTKSKHSHSPDEPLSYKQGEDQLPIKLKNSVGSVPLAIALSESSKINKNYQPKLVEQKAKNVENVDTISVQRQKREVVDCTEKTTLKPEDREICENLINKQIEHSEILPKVDLNNVLTNMQPVHHIRSLKSYSEAKENQ